MNRRLAIMTVILIGLLTASLAGCGMTPEEADAFVADMRATLVDLQADVDAAKARGVEPGLVAKVEALIAKGERGLKLFQANRNADGSIGPQNWLVAGLSLVPEPYRSGATILATIVGLGRSFQARSTSKVLARSINTAAFKDPNFSSALKANADLLRSHQTPAAKAVVDLIERKPVGILRRLPV